MTKGDRALGRVEACPCSLLTHPLYVGTVFSIAAFAWLCAVHMTIGPCDPLSKRCMTC
jgi:hypothetical protein